jgi:hypothetical protein
MVIDDDVGDTIAIRVLDPSAGRDAAYDPRREISWVAELRVGGRFSICS